MRVPNFETGMLKWFFQLQDRKFEVLSFSTINNLKTFCGVHTVFPGAPKRTYCLWVIQQTKCGYKMIQACCFLLAFHLSAFLFWMITAFQPFLAVYSGLPKYVYQTFPATLQDIVQNGRLTPGMAAVVRRDPDSTGLHVFIYEHKSIVDWQAARWLQNHQTIKPSNHINNISLNYPLKLGHCMALLFCIFVLRGLPETFRKSSYLATLPAWEHLTHIHERATRFLFSRRPSAPMILARAAHWVRKTSCGSAEGGSKQRCEFESGASSSPWSLGELWEL